jgi:hypothetical protein
MAKVRKATTMMDVAETDGNKIRKQQFHAVHHPTGKFSAQITVYLKNFEVFRWHEDFKKCFSTYQFFDGTRPGP